MKRLYKKLLKTLEKELINEVHMFVSFICGVCVL